MIAPDRSYGLGIDVGTSSCKVCVADDAGRCIGGAAHPYETHSPEPGWSEQDPGDWIAALIASVPAAIASAGIHPSDVRWLSLTSAAHIAVLTDRRDRPLRRAILWNDQRSAAEARAFSKRHGDLILERTFNRVSTTWSLPHLAWVCTHDAPAWRRTARIYFSKDFIARWMTGEAVTDPATAVASMLFDAVSGEWSEEMCGWIGLDPGALPRVQPVRSVCGGLRPQAAEALRLRAGIPVVNGTLDSAAETYCAGANRPGECVIRLGTAGGIHIVKAAPRPHPQLITYPHPVPGLWYSQAGTNSAGSAIAKMAGVFGGLSPLSEVIEAAAAVPAGAEGLFFHPFLSGERCPYWDPHLRGTFLGISVQHQAAHFMRAVIEGVSYSLKDAFLTIAAEEPCAGILRVVGGGTANRLWTRVLSNVLGRALTVMNRADSAYGAALLGLAAVASDTASALSYAGSEGVIVSPDTEAQAAYQRGFDIYKKWCSHLLPAYRETCSPSVA